MQLYNVAAWLDAKHKPGDKPEWESNLVADSVEEAYRNGSELFRTERPELDHDSFIIEASY